MADAGHQVHRNASGQCSACEAEEHTWSPPRPEVFRLRRGGWVRLNRAICICGKCFPACQERVAYVADWERDTMTITIEQADDGPPLPRRVKDESLADFGPRPEYPLRRTLDKKLGKALIEGIARIGEDEPGED